jgi:hypothetical protein
MNARQEEMLAMIDTLLALPSHMSEPPEIREIARWVTCGYSATWPEIQYVDGEALETALIGDLRDLWPEATDENIRRGVSLAVTAAEPWRDW